MFYNLMQKKLRYIETKLNKKLFFWRLPNKAHNIDIKAHYVVW